MGVNSIERNTSSDTKHRPLLNNAKNTRFLLLPLWEERVAALKEKGNGIAKTDLTSGQTINALIGLIVHYALKMKYCFEEAFVLSQ